MLNSKENTMPQPLWTKDFTIITLGTIVSMLGNAVSGFAISLMVLDYTNSTFLYAVFMVCYMLPQVIVPLFAGPYLDRFSRRKTIYTLDFISSGIYVCMAIVLYMGMFNYTAFLVVSIIVGSINSMYTVAYESFYPSLISEGNFSRAYSISSLIYPLANTIMVPVASYCYDLVGMVPLFAFNAVCFFVAAVFETQISAQSEHLEQRKVEHFNLERYRADFREGLDYLKAEKGLIVITAYFFVTLLAGGVHSTLAMPFFRSHAVFTVQDYSFVMAISTFGRLVGGVIHYRFRYPTAKKFAIAMAVYVSITVLEGSYMYMPYWAMLVMNFLVGILGVTSYNIRISATQNHLDDAKRGRFNGIFQMITTCGTVVGELMGGALGEVYPPQYIVSVAMLINCICAFAIMYRGREHVKPIYNRNI